ncbi:MAG: ABC transporter permease [Vicinamibacterales bacterium]
MSRSGALLLACVCLAVLGAPWLAPHDPAERFPNHLYAPPMVPRVLSDGMAVPHVRPLRLVSRLERRFEADASAPVALEWFTRGHVVSVPASAGTPLLLLGADALGRDVLSRLLHAGRPSLALALVATLGTLLLGGLLGAAAGYAGGLVDEWLSRLSDFVLVLPALYVVVVLRAVLPLVLPAPAVFVLLAVIFVAVGWPVVARGVRAIVRAERERDYVLASQALGATPVRVLWRHLLPAARGHLLAQGALLLPAFILAEATLSYVGFGFPDTTPTWGTMLQEASSAALAGDAPWLLAPAGAIFVVVLGVNLLVQGGGRPPVSFR